MFDPISESLAMLPKTSKTELSRLWREVFQLPSSPKLRRDLMIPILAYRIQEQVLGPLPIAVLAVFSALAETLEWIIVRSFLSHQVSNQEPVFFASSEIKFTSSPWKRGATNTEVFATRVFLRLPGSSPALAGQGHSSSVLPVNNPMNPGRHNDC